MSEVSTTASGAGTKSPVKTVLLWLVILGAAVIMWQVFTVDSVRLEISYNQFQELIAEGQVADVTFRDRRILGILKEPVDARADFELVLPFEPDAAFVEELMASGVIVHGEQLEDSPLLAVFLTWGPVLVIVGLWIYFMRIYTRREGGSESQDV